jgi:fatty-acyl-CoA synthase
MGWNYGDILDAVAGAVPGDKPALIHGDTVVSWADFTRRTNNLARALQALGLKPDDKVAFYMRNHPAYCETLGACFKARLVHVNVNYRYVDDELHYILDNSDARVVVYGPEFQTHVDALRERLPGVVRWLAVGAEFDDLAETGDGSALDIQRSGDDLLLLYTGGTTGMPKGVMWPHDEHWRSGTSGGNAATGLAPPKDVGEHAANMAALGGGGRMMPCCPLMHGTGLFTAMGTLALGGTVVTMEGESFDAVEAWSLVEKHGVNSMAIVGDAFAKPMLRALEEDPSRFDVSSLLGILSSGVMWSPEVKQGLLKYNQNMVLMDSFGASEAVGFGRSDTTAQGTTEVARFQLGEGCKVFTEDFREVEPGSGEAGFVARSGPIPLGYYKDRDKTAKTFPVIDGVRYSIPGDFCRVEADGTLVLLGRGSVCINSAGEKIFPEEVEEILKTSGDVHDALVVGVPDDKWGQMVTAVVELERSAAFDEAELREFVRGKLAGYKTPKRVFPIERMLRASNGKADYKGITAFAKAQLGIE